MSDDIVVIPGTGTVLSLDETDVERIAMAWDDLLSVERDVRTAKRTISDEITRRLDFEGRRQLTIDGVRLETTAPEERDWDYLALQQLLRQLVNEGTISEKKADACIKWEPKVVWAEIKPLTTDPRCSARMAQTFKMVPANRYAKVSRAR